MDLLDTGRQNLEGALTASDQATQLANQLQAARAQMTMANRSANAQAQGQMAGSLGALGIAAYPQISNYVSGLGASNAAAPAANVAGTGTGGLASTASLSSSPAAVAPSGFLSGSSAANATADTAALSSSPAAVAPSSLLAGDAAEGAAATGGEAAGDGGLMASMPELGALGPIGLGIGAAAAIAGLCGLFN